MNDNVFKVKLKLEDIAPAVDKIRKEVECRVLEETHRCSAFIAYGTQSDGSAQVYRCFYWNGHPNPTRHLGIVISTDQDGNEYATNMFTWEDKE